MIKAYSQRLMPPYSGQVQIAESDRARALTVDGKNWEIHFCYAGSLVQGGQRSYRRAAYINPEELHRIQNRSEQECKDVDERIIELADYLATARLPFPAADRFEYWLLDRAEGLPLALIFSCTEASQMATYPERPEWTALPAAVLPIQFTEAEQSRNAPPVNHQLESLVAQRAGSRPVARWFERGNDETHDFPPCLIREQWQDPTEQELCQRYINRQSTRLLMLHNLTHADRLRLEIAAKDHIFEVERFYPLYPEVADEALMSAMRVEARLRGSEAAVRPLSDRRDGVLYI